MAGRVRVLIVDDSELCRASLRAALEHESDIEVVGEAPDGWTACQLAESLKPSVITMDLQMPGMGGLDTIERIMRRQPTPILVVTERPTVGGADATFASLSRGAMELLPKSAQLSPTSAQANQLRNRVRALSGVAWEGEKRGEQPAESTLVGASLPRVVGIGASTGGPKALSALLCRLSGDFSLPVLLVQHMDAHFQDSFTDWLGKHSALPVRPVVDGEPLVPGEVRVAPQGRHLVVDPGGLLRLRAPAEGDRHAPSVDELFRSLATVYREHAVGVLLSGMGEDGAAGLKAMRDAGAITMAQDRSSSVVYGMPGAAVSQGAVEWVLPIERMAAVLTELASSQRAPPRVQGTRPKVLIVDDSEVVLEVARWALERAGLEVLVLNNPLAVPGVIRREKPHLVLLDVNMPAVSGEAVTRIVREHGLSGSLRVLLFSELPAEELNTRAQRCGAHGFVQKGGGPEAIVQAVRAHLSGT